MSEQPAPIEHLASLAALRETLWAVQEKVSAYAAELPEFVHILRGSRLPSDLGYYPPSHTRRTQVPVGELPRGHARWYDFFDRYHGSYAESCAALKEAVHAVLAASHWLDGQEGLLERTSSKMLADLECLSELVPYPSTSWPLPPSDPTAPSEIMGRLATIAEWDKRLGSIGEAAGRGGSSGSEGSPSSNLAGGPSAPTVHEFRDYLVRWNSLAKYLQVQGITGVGHRVQDPRVKSQLPTPVHTKRRLPPWFRLGQAWEAARALASNPEELDSIAVGPGLVEQLRPPDWCP